jgi:hypothetical protein
MRAFEGALDEKWCHIVVGFDAACLCGAPDPGGDDCPDVAPVDGRCRGCGGRPCIDCERIWRERYA